jgi:hypothetical protein
MKKVALFFGISNSFRYFCGVNLKERNKMETINIQFQVPSTGQYTLDEFIAKLKDYAEKLASSISKSENSYQERYMSQAEQEAYVAESLNRALDEMEAHKKNGTKPMDARDLLRRLREEEA